MALYLYQLERDGWDSPCAMLDLEKVWPPVHQEACALPIFTEFRIHLHIQPSWDEGV